MHSSQHLLAAILVLAAATFASSRLHGNRDELNLLRDIAALEEELLLRRDSDSDNVRSGSARTEASPARVGAFNIQIFGDTKYSKPEVVASLVQILQRYDICLVMEIRDADGSSFPSLVNDVNAAAYPIHYEYVISERLGATSSKEQYAFLYRPDIFEVEATYQYPESPAFNREPYAVILRSPTLAIENFALMAIHTDPDDADTEIDALVDAYDALVIAHNIEDVIIMGDLNAGCSYVSDSDWANIRLRTQTRFDWLIDDETDTTVSNSDCPYDRFVVAGGGSIECAIVADSVAVYHFDQTLGLSQDEALDVSDHYPIELVIKIKSQEAEDPSVNVFDSINVEGDIYADNMDDITDYLKEKQPENLGYVVKSYGDLIRLTSEGVSDVIKLMQDTEQRIPDLATHGVITGVINYFRDASALLPSPEFPCSENLPAATFQIQIELEPGKCRIMVLRKVN